MDIVGIGIDATEIHRIAESIERWGDRFVDRVFTAGEIAYSRRRRDCRSRAQSPARIDGHRASR